MKRHHRDALALISGIMEPRGLVCEFTVGGKHAAVVVRSKSGQKRAKFPVSGSPRDADCQLNQIRQQVHAWLDAHGMATGRGRTGRRKAGYRPRVKSTIRRVEVLIEPDSGPARDPWAVLAGFRVEGRD